LEDIEESILFIIAKWRIEINANKRGNTIFKLKIFPNMADYK